MLFWCNSQTPWSSIHLLGFISSAFRGLGAEAGLMFLSRIMQAIQGKVAAEV
jgi:hypothetical protein